MECPTGPEGENFVTRSRPLTSLLMSLSAEVAPSSSSLWIKSRRQATCGGAALSSCRPWASGAHRGESRHRISDAGALCVFDQPSDSRPAWMLEQQFIAGGRLKGRRIFLASHWHLGIRRLAAFDAAGDAERVKLGNRFGFSGAPRRGHPRRRSAELGLESYLDGDPAWRRLFAELAFFARIASG